VRPSAGERGNCAVLAIELGAANMSVEIEARAGEV
jgi:hypothetical protein